MIPHKGESAFTLIEVLVASLLLGMLVIILTMVFNQSSIAWRTGKASIVQMDKMRRLMSQVQRRGGELLPGVKPGSESTFGCVCSAWDNTEWNGQKGSLNKRAVVNYTDSKYSLNSLINTSLIRPGERAQAWMKPNENFNSADVDALKSFAVGVWSYGPDREPGTADDISTWPDEME